ncbi:Protein of unknown function [Faunimonas pinastri]|uniref:Tlde1 domain-containing protein n=1 Tax=Faunimonas pinastri TaxID=1855383 RepID=A0A1H9IGX2_9HYPH|nr:DUF2778 domain-containing protein [Faunimonas pinastri]SEQ73853.1 Protein of unknown function [Faunimonas pinastri]
MIRNFDDSSSGGRSSRGFRKMSTALVGTSIAAALAVVALPATRTHLFSLHAAASAGAGLPSVQAPGTEGDANSHRYPLAPRGDRLVVHQERSADRGTLLRNGRFAWQPTPMQLARNSDRYGGYLAAPVRIAATELASRFRSTTPEWKEAFQLPGQLPGQLPTQLAASPAAAPVTLASLPQPAPDVSARSLEVASASALRIPTARPIVTAELGADTEAPASVEAEIPMVLPSPRPSIVAQSPVQSPVPAPVQRPTLVARAEAEPARAAPIIKASYTQETPATRPEPGTRMAVPRQQNSTTLAYASPDEDVDGGKSENIFGRLFGRGGGMANLPGPSSGVAVYDIASASVRLPNGQRLEAHSGLSRMQDDARFVHEKNRGPTPPNVYNLVARERLFHGAAAIRLLPADGRKKYNRDGLLAHPYMYIGGGDRSQSNGCVVFKDYNRFLAAFRAGLINRLVVVPNMNELPTYMAML